MARILIIDDEKTILENLKFILELEGFEVLIASSGSEGISLFLENPDIDAVISDMRMPGLSGIDVIKSIHQQNPDLGVIILTGNGDLENAISAMKEGAFDYLSKPVQAEKLIITLNNAVKRLNLIRENQQLNDEIQKKNQYFEMIHEAAQQILLNMAPIKVPNVKSIQIAAVYKCCDQVGGDMYDVFQLGDYTFFYLFDVCGHGILSAVMTMILKTSFNNLKFLYEKAGIIPPIQEIIHNINHEMYSNTASNLFATLFAGIYDSASKEFTYISAGHIDQYLIGKDGLKVLESTGTVLGIFHDADYEPSCITIEPNDRLFLFSDGITEIMRDDIIYTTDEIARIITETVDKPLHETVETIYNELSSLYENKVPDDDITIVGLAF